MKRKEVCKQESGSTHGRHEQLVNLLHCTLELDLSPVLGVLHRDEHMEVLVQMLPVGFASVLFLLDRERETFEMH